MIFWPVSELVLVLGFASHWLVLISFNWLSHITASWRHDTHNTYIFDAWVARWFVLNQRPLCKSLWNVFFWAFRSRNLNGWISHYIDFKHHVYKKNLCLFAFIYGQWSLFMNANILLNFVCRLVWSMATVTWHCFLILILMCSSHHTCVIVVVGFV